MSDNPMPPIEIAAPRLRRRERGLLLGVAELIENTALYPNDPGERPFTTYERIVGGVTFCPQGCANLDVFENAWCSEITLPNAGPVTPQAETFSSFTVVGREDGPARFDPMLAENRIVQRFDTQISAQVARELATGTTTGNPSLQSEASVVVEGVTVDDALFVLDDQLATVDNAAGTILASPATFELLVNAYDVTEDGGVFSTATGHNLVGDSGFDGAGPDGNVVAGESWVYAIIGRPHYWLGERTRIGTEDANFTRVTNQRSTVFTQEALVAFENCLVVAVQVEVPSYEIGS